MSGRVESFAAVRHDFVTYVTDIIYATMVTVDRSSRPRARILIVAWEVEGSEPVGWLATFRTPVKVAHLAGNPHTTLSYWNPRQNAVHIDGVASWEDEADIRHHVWDLYRHGSPPGLGYEPRSFWRGGPDDPTFGVLRIDPWRVQIIRGRDLRSLIWKAPE